MILLTYNIRGLGSREKRWALREMVLRERVEVLLLQETKLDSVDQRIVLSDFGG